MKKPDFNQALQTLIIGDETDKFVCQVITLLSKYKLEFVRLGDIYSAIVWLTKNSHENILVVGRIEQLNKEQGRFLKKVREKGCYCCCLADQNIMQKQEISAAAQNRKILFINEPAEIESIIVQLVTDTAALPKEKPSIDFKDEFRISDAERDALLGV